MRESLSQWRSFLACRVVIGIADAAPTMILKWNLPLMANSFIYVKVLSLDEPESFHGNI